jgi:membrane protein DedA with SNARE-associated domain
MDWLTTFVHWLVEFIHQLGYAGIFITTFIESTFVPIPAELTVVPAGYLVHQGRMELFPVWFLSIAGAVCGSYANYMIARSLGRSVFIRYGKYFFFTEEKLHTIERFFEKYGVISTFTGRLIPGVRHFIAFPAGLAKMPLRPFLIYTTLGSGIWMTILVALGYYIGQNEALLTTYLPLFKLGIVLLLVLGVVIHFYRRSRKDTAP